MPTSCNLQTHVYRVSKWYLYVYYIYVIYNNNIHNNRETLKRVQVNARLTDGVGGSRTPLRFLSFAAAAIFLLFRRQMLRAAREERVTTDTAAATVAAVAVGAAVFIVSEKNK